jgi:hypothetical protein
LVRGKPFTPEVSPDNLKQMNKTAIQTISLLFAASLIVAFAIYEVTFWLFSTQPYLTSRTDISATDMIFFEGLMVILAGVLLFLGSGGISRRSQQAALLASAAKAFDNDVIGPSEIFRRDAWKPKGFTRTALILIMAGIILLVTYFVSI